jgi:hypothetical protein
MAGPGESTGGAWLPWRRRRTPCPDVLLRWHGVLAELMIDHGVGTSISRSDEVRRIDSDDFLEDDC